MNKGGIRMEMSVVCTPNEARGALQLMLLHLPDSVTASKHNFFCQWHQHEAFLVQRFRQSQVTAESQVAATCAVQPVCVVGFKPSRRLSSVVMLYSLSERMKRIEMPAYGENKGTCYSNCLFPPMYM